MEKNSQICTFVRLNIVVNCKLDASSQDDYNVIHFKSHFFYKSVLMK